MIRYEAAAERSLRKALDRLETLQRRRRGEAPPPRLNAHASRSKLPQFTRLVKPSGTDYPK
jgi:hypothetical protein